MGLLGGILYDPAVAVTKSTATLIGMTALDTTNLRITFTVPAGGCAFVRMAGVIHGAATYPQILLGVMNGATVVKRQRPMAGINGTAGATNFLTFEGTFTVTGLTAGASTSWDAAYGVETIVASTGIKYGGPNDTTAGNAFGGFCYEVWEA